MKKFVASLVPLLFCSQAVFAEGLTEEDLQACYGLEFEHENMTPEMAFHIGQCFSQLADLLPDNDDLYYSDYASEPGELTNRNAALHYASSWYEHASDYGHPEAEAQLMLTWDELWD